MISISLKSYENKLKSAKIPKNEISIVVHNLGELQKAGYDAKVITTIVDEIQSKLEFRQAFIADYKGAADKILLRFRKH